MTFSPETDSVGSFLFHPFFSEEILRELAKLSFMDQISRQCQPLNCQRQHTEWNWKH